MENYSNLYLARKHMWQFTAFREGRELIIGPWAEFFLNLKIWTDLSTSAVIRKPKSWLLLYEKRLKTNALKYLFVFIFNFLVVFCSSI